IHNIFPAGVALWVLTLILCPILRIVLFQDTSAPAFIFFTAAVLGIFLLGRRRLATLVTRARQPPSTAPSTPYRWTTVTAFVMIKTDTHRIPEIATELADKEGITQVYSVTGTWDLIAMVRVREFDQLEEVISDRLSKVTGIQATETLLAFRAYSQHDLDEGFALGFD